MTERIETDKATRADWGWLERSDLSGAFRRALVVYGGRYRLDPDELYGEALLYLGVRYKRITTTGAVWELVKRCSRTMAERSRREPNFLDVNPDIM